MLQVAMGAGATELSQSMHACADSSHTCSADQTCPARSAPVVGVHPTAMDRLDMAPTQEFGAGSAIPSVRVVQGQLARWLQVHACNLHDRD